MASVAPVAKAIYLCDEHVGYGDGKVDLYGLFNAIRPASEYPYVNGRFCVFTQLVSGLGVVSYFVDIRDAATLELVWTSIVRTLTFPARSTVLYVVQAVEACCFPRSGLYLVEVYCNNAWVCDTQFSLL